jgi:DNA-binding LacI/PurR family transcriptional regulator
MLRKHQWVVKELEKAFQENRYAVGDRLPSERDMAGTFGVSPLTVRRALAVLENVGLIKRLPSRGTFFVGGDKTWSESSTPGTVALVYMNVPSTEHPRYRDIVRQHNFEFNELAAELSLRKLALMWSQSSTLELSRGEYPHAISRESTACIVLSGFVEDYHVHMFQELGIPVMLMGNRPVNLPVSSLHVNRKEMAYLLTRELIEFYKGPAIFVVSPFQLYYIHEMVEGYCLACEESGMPTQVSVITGHGNPAEELATILDRSGGEFSLLLAYHAAYALPDIYRKHGWNFIDHPVIATNASVDFYPDDLREQISVVGCD